MSKLSMIEREKKRQKLVNRYSQKRQKFLILFEKAETMDEKFEFHGKIQKLPRNSAKIRLRNRCWRTGRSRGFYRDFGLCRHMIREMAHNCILPGLHKSSW